MGPSLGVVFYPGWPSCRPLAGRCRTVWLWHCRMSPHHSRCLHCVQAVAPGHNGQGILVLYPHGKPEPFSGQSAWPVSVERGSGQYVICSASKWSKTSNLLLKITWWGQIRFYVDQSLSCDQPNWSTTFGKTNLVLSTSFCIKYSADFPDISTTIENSKKLPIQHQPNCWGSASEHQVEQMLEASFSFLGVTLFFGKCDSVGFSWNWTHIPSVLRNPS